MANRMYAKGLNRFAIGAVDWTAGTIQVALVRSAFYTPDTDVDEFMADVTAGGADLARATIANRSAALGVCDGDDVTFSAVSGGVANYLVVFKVVTDDTDSPLLFIYDTATGLPITPNGGDITIAWSNGANKIFKL